MPPAVSGSSVVRSIGRFIAACARADGGVNPGPDPSYRGSSDTAVSDIAAPVYSLILEETFGLKILDRTRTLRFLESALAPDGFYRGGKRSGRGKPYLLLYDTLQALLGMRIIRRNTVPHQGPDRSVRAVMKLFNRGHHYRFPAFALDFFGQFFAIVKRRFPRGIARAVSRSYLEHYRDGEAYGHIASTFHFVRHARLTNVRVPFAGEILEKTFSLQRPNGSFNNMPDPDWDVHATFDGCFIIRQLGALLGQRARTSRAIKAAGKYALRCRNADGGFGHFPGRKSDIDAVYFHAGTLVMAGVLPARRVPRDLAKVLGWGHLFPVPATMNRARVAYNTPRMTPYR